MCVGWWSIILGSLLGWQQGLGVVEPIRSFLAYSEGRETWKRGIAAASDSFQRTTGTQLSPVMMFWILGMLLGATAGRACGWYSSLSLPARAQEASPGPRRFAITAKGEVQPF